jgi:hypothetical protein
MVGSTSTTSAIRTRRRPEDNTLRRRAVKVSLRSLHSPDFHSTCSTLLGQTPSLHSEISDSATCEGRSIAAEAPSAQSAAALLHRLFCLHMRSSARLHDSNTPRCQWQAEQAPISNLCFALRPRSRRTSPFLPRRRTALLHRRAGEERRKEGTVCVERSALRTKQPSQKSVSIQR